MPATHHMRNSPLLGRLFARAFMEGEPGAGGAPAGGAAPAANAAPQTFSAEYVRELREENKTWRLKHQEATGASKEATDKLTAAEAAANERVTKAEQAANDRVLKAELKAIAKGHGVIDVTDALKVLDLSAVKLDADGNVVGADELFEAAKKAKPYLFGTGDTTNTKTKKPPVDEGKPVDVRKLTPAEYEAQKKQYLADARKQ